MMRPHWKPKPGQMYWFVDLSATHVDSFKFKTNAWQDGKGTKGTSIDVLMWKTGNCFRTEAQAKAAAKIIRGVFKQIQEDSQNFPEFFK